MPHLPQRRPIGIPEIRSALPPWDGGGGGGFTPPNKKGASREPPGIFLKLGLYKRVIVS